MIISCYFLKNGDDRDISTIVIGALLSLTVIGAVSCFDDYFNPKPQAIDVYRNKTELVINGEYKDSVFIPADSVVVFKIKEE